MVSVRQNVDEEQSPAEARKLLSFLLRNDATVIFTRHALDEADKDGCDRVDIRNVLGAGLISEPAEWKESHAQWRYRAHTQRFCVVFTFEKITSDVTVVAVTFWDKEK